ncbi:hypothetical protein PGT21_027828 [Puccinia graminis f. sp. tritici]|nr:hypothetical protein PGT21_027828 [Puccinia graminis f. sp. tritici]
MFCSQPHQPTENNPFDRLNNIHLNQRRSSHAALTEGPRNAEACRSHPIIPGPEGTQQ